MSVLNNIYGMLFNIEEDDDFLFDDNWVVSFHGERTCGFAYEGTPLLHDSDWIVIDSDKYLLKQVEYNLITLTKAKIKSNFNDARDNARHNYVNKIEKIYDSILHLQEKIKILQDNLADTDDVSDRRMYLNDIDCFSLMIFNHKKELKLYADSDYRFNYTFEKTTSNKVYKLKSGVTYKIGDSYIVWYYHTGQKPKKEYITEEDVIEKINDSDHSDLNNSLKKKLKKLKLK